MNKQLFCALLTISSIGVNAMMPAKAEAAPFEPCAVEGQDYQYCFCYTLPGVGDRCIPLG